MALPTVSLSDAVAAADFGKQIGEQLAKLSDRGTEFIIKNKARMSLDLFAHVTGQTSGGKGSGFWVQHEGPPALILSGDEGVCALESNSAGAVGLIIYSLGAHRYAMIYAAAPLTTDVRSHVKLVYAPGWNHLSKKDRQNLANGFFMMMDWNDGVMDSETSAFGFRLAVTTTGNKEIAAEFTLTYDGSRSICLQSVSTARFLCVNPLGTFHASPFGTSRSQSRDGQWVMSQSDEYWHIAAFRKPPDYSDCVLRWAGSPASENVCLSYHNPTGSAMLWEGDTHWQIKPSPSGVPGFYTLYNTHYEDYLWMTGDVPKLKGGGDPYLTTAQFKIHEITM